MTLEEKLSGWTGPSSTTEQEKQERTERMVREALDAHPAFSGCSRSVYAKGSYKNNTNVKSDSDVDIAVQCNDLYYYDEATPGLVASGGGYTGDWTPSRWRAEVVAALRTKFGDQVDASGSTAIAVNSSSARVDADVVPCFDYRYYLSSTTYRSGARVYKTTGGHIENYESQHYTNGVAKNTATGTYFKQAVRILKRIENEMVAKGVHREVPSYFVECLVYNCPNSIFRQSTWTSTVSGLLIHIWQCLQGDEPETGRWLEVNECKYLFFDAQKWSRKDGRDFAYAAWNHLGLGDA
jgi:hypothetical protein